MTVQKVIKQSLLTYPSLYKTKGDILFHTLCSYGAGYEWEKGEIIQIIPTKYCNTIEESIKRQFETFLSNDALVSSSLSFSREYLLESILTALKWENNSKDISVKERTYEIERYLSLEYSPIFNVPDNIKEDWKTAVLQMIDYLLTVLTDEKYIKKLQDIKDKLT